MDADGAKSFAPGAGARPDGPAAPRSWPAESIAARLFDEPYAFDFFQAVRLLQNLDRRRSLVGLGAVPGAEAVRFRSLVSMNFPPSSIFDLAAQRDPRQPPLMTVAFMGLTGPSGVLPRHYTEMLLRLQRDAKGPERHVFRDWLDLFNHRFISLFHRAWEKYRFWTAYERGESYRTQPDTFTTALYSLIGMGTPGLSNRLRVSTWEEATGKGQERVLARVPDPVLAYFSGLLSHRPRHAAGLAGMLQDYFRAPVAVHQFQGQWLRLDAENQSRLGTLDGNSDLGVNLVIGERVWDVQGKIRIVVGPLAFHQFLTFMPDRTPLPDRKAFFELVHLVRFYIGAELDFDVQLILAAPEVPECQLPESTADGPRLGWDTWLGSQSFAEDATEAIFEGEEVVFVN
ncbi:MAG: type VI secretion system baseplate subunit TssG [Planctomycetia bacterium]|nr:type VI secretion system baseplate subunit TssG [Planctomycetia bacterium]